MIGVLFDNFYDLLHHCWFGCGLSGGVYSGNVAIAPYFYFAILGYVEHILLDFEAAEMLVQHLEAPETHIVELYAILKA